jgi:hypothetical protein|nr:DUF4007 family protein [Yoonia sp.]
MIEKAPKSRSKTEQRVKGHFSGHETFPLRQLWLTKAFRYAAEHNFDSGCFALESAIADLGVGKNMVSSMRHWALATDVLTEDSNGLRPGRIGELVIGTKDSPGTDPWFESNGSVWLIHWLLSGRGRRSTTWRWLFSRVNDASLEREKLVAQLGQWCEDQGMTASANTLRRDLEACLRCYLPRASAVSGEEAAEPLLSELSLLSTNGTQTGVRFNKGPKQSLDDGVFYFAVMDFWDLKHVGQPSTPATIPLMNLALDFYSPGRVFKLSEEELETRLLSAEVKTGGGLVYDEGLKSLSINHSRLTPQGAQTDREANKHELLKLVYSTHGLAA